MPPQRFLTATSSASHYINFIHSTVQIPVHNLSITHTCSKQHQNGLILLSLLNHWTSVPPSLKSSWKSSDSTPCSWIGIKCDRYNNLVFLNLTASQIFGPLGTEIGQLTHLQNFSLAINGFSGTIPPELGNCSLLEYIDLSKNQLSGKMPPEIGNCKSLKSLREIPLTIWKIQSLKHVLLQDNNLTGKLSSELTELKHLKNISLSDNQFFGPIPQGSIPKFEGNQNLLVIDIGKNNISGVIPSSLGNCTNLIGLILSMNNIIGLIPSELGNLVKLQALNIAHNNLEGILPPELLILRENHFSGFFPYFFSGYTQLLELQLGGNMIQGTIPASIGSLVHLYELNLSANKLTGGIPEDIGKLKMLESLDISLNSLTESIQVLGEFVSLTEVNISYNSFFGPLPEWKIQRLNLSPSSFLGNLGLCVSCSTSDGLRCLKTSHLKQCATNSTDQEGNKHSNLVFGLISYMEVNVNCEEKEALFSNHERGFRIIDLIDAADFLHDRYIIGGGGHGIVYKAELGVGVFAIKVKLARSNRRKLNLFREIEMTKNFMHENVARCLGSSTCEEYGLTISRCMENGSLHDVLHESNPQTCLSWNVRYKITIGIAKGLAYLHHDCDPPILHRDIKPKNILLDSDMHPYITDFGISIALNQSSTMVRMRSMYHLGTRGFMAPEIACLIVPGCEIDAYSYGVVLLELITRKKVLDSSFMEVETTLVGWFKSIWRRTTELEEIVDSSLARELSDLNVKVQVIKVLLVVLICTEAAPGKRLKMRDVVEFFEAPTDPGIFVQHDKAFHLGSSLASASASIFFQEEVKITTNRGFFPILGEVMKANANENNPNIIGRGTHGVVYKVQQGTSLVYAVKKVTFAGNKGKIQSIFREITILGMIKHRNLLRLLDFQFKKDYCLILYSYMSNKNLHEVLHGKNPLPPVEWNVRCRIAAGIAHGLAYLHYDCHPAIVHRAIKPKNMLVDSDMEPHIADFGTAKLLDQSSSASSSSSLVPNTLGYTTPEDTCTTANTREFDVYSYGIVLLQLITRKKAMDLSFMEGTEIGIWARILWEETGDIQNIVDSSLAEEKNPHETHNERCYQAIRRYY
ncbi:receptor-like protein kinase [Prosopis cineraria]|uniref:receptor-like protein kinase n=1 Tax=Prosopis cineraria TaxID=364024 RepID=UPI00240FF58F|nr:receptor-like protein kinase [Prosopis cineraria]